MRAVQVGEAAAIPPMTCVIDFDSNLPGVLGECEVFVFKQGKREVRCTKEELYDTIERLLHA